MKKIVQDEGGMFDEDTELTLWAEETEKSTRDENGRCHDDNGYLTSCGGGSGSDSKKPDKKPERKPSSDLPSWMEGKPKPEKKPEKKPEEKPPREPGGMDRAPDKYETDRDRIMNPPKKPQTKPQGRPKPNGPKGTWLPDKNGKYPYPIAKHARTDLAPLVGKKVKVSYWVENVGGPSFTNRSVNTRCVRDIQVEGVKEPVHHVWAQEPTKEMSSAPYGEVQTATAQITAYDKGKHGEQRYMDFSVQMFEDTKPTGETHKVQKLTRDENGRCHDDNGYLASCGGGSGDKPSSKPDKKPEDKPDKEPSSKPEDDFDPNDVPTPGDEKKPGKPEDLPDDEDPGFPEDKQPKTAPLSGPEQLAVSTYQGADYAFINTWMRNPDNGGNKQDREYYLRKAENIARAIDKQPPLKGEEVVYRGIRTNKETIKAFVKDAVIEDPAFMSTTTDREIAKNFGNTILTIRVPKGTRALRMTDVVDNVSSRTEAEMLLQRKTKIKITHVRQESGGLFGMGAKTYIEARVI